MACPCVFVSYLSTLCSFDRLETAVGLLGDCPVVPLFRGAAVVMALTFRLLVVSSYRYLTFSWPPRTLTGSLITVLLLTTCERKKRQTTDKKATSRVNTIHFVKDVLIIALYECVQ